MAYVVDADVFIRAKNLHYGFDFCPAFWDWLIEANARGVVRSIEKVGGELTAGEDALADWAEARGEGFFLDEDPTLLPALGSVSSWAMSAGYEPAAVNTFFQSADYYLIATGLARGDTVVTHEVASNSKRRVKIPDACIALGIKCVTPYEMLRYERARFVLGAGKTKAT